jgi:hypothetical protein
MMSGTHDSAVEAMTRLLAELPAEFSDEPRVDNQYVRESFQVIKKRNVRTVHEALWELQQFLGMRDE